MLISSKIFSDKIYWIPHNLATAMCTFSESNQTKLLVQYGIFEGFGWACVERDGRIRKRSFLNNLCYYEVRKNLM